MLEQALFGDDDPVAVISAFCAEHLGSAVADVVLRSAGVGFVLGAVLDDGRTVVVKVHRWQATPDRLAAAHRVQAALAVAGVPMATPLATPAPLGTGIGTVEAFLPSDRASARRPEVRRAVAGALAALVAAGRDLVGTPGLRRAALARPEGALWPEPHDLRFDFTASAAGTEWIDELAEEGFRRLAATALPDVVGHLDWRVENLGFHGDRVVAIFDADSLGVAPEAFVVGSSMGQFTTDWAAGEPPPSVDEMLAFVADYEAARGEPFDDQAWDVLDAANLCHLAYVARCERASVFAGLGSSVGFATLLRARGRNLPRGRAAHP